MLFYGNFERFWRTYGKNFQAESPATEVVGTSPKVLFALGGTLARAWILGGNQCLFSGPNNASRSVRLDNFESGFGLRIWMLSIEFEEFSESAWVKIAMKVCPQATIVRISGQEISFQTELTWWHGLVLECSGKELLSRRKHENSKSKKW